MLTRSLPLSLAACLCTLVACSKDDGDTDPSASTSAATDAPGTDASSASQSTTDAPATTSGDASSDGPGSATTAASDPTTATPTTGNGETTDHGETTDPSAGETTTAPAPTDGPGVLPGETGIDSFCRRYVECGGTYYADEQACLDETFGYWGECPSRRAALDAFGACMSELDCSEWNPDAYNPGSTPCAQQWSDLNASEAC
jgi:hypothetical protein